MIDYFTGFDNLGGDFTVHEFGEEQCRSGHAFGPYIRQSYFLHYIYEGKGIFEAEGRTYHLKKGQMFLICPGQLTYYKADDNDPWFYRWISFDGGASELLLRHAGIGIDNPIFLDDDNMSAGRALEEIVRNGVTSFCSVMSRFWKFADAVSKKHQQVKEPREYVGKVKAHIHSHYMENVSVSDMAASVGIDRSYLCRLFKAREGISPQEYLIRYRLRLAKSLLRETDHSVGAVAKMVGYEDAADFSKIFKSREGVPPMKWRDKTHLYTDEGRE